MAFWSAWLWPVKLCQEQSSLHEAFYSSHRRTAAANRDNGVSNPLTSCHTTKGDCCTLRWRYYSIQAHLGFFQLKGNLSQQNRVYVNITLARNKSLLPRQRLDCVRCMLIQKKFIYLKVHQWLGKENNKSLQVSWAIWKDRLITASIFSNHLLQGLLLPNLYLMVNSWDVLEVTKLLVKTSPSVITDTLIHYMPNKDQSSLSPAYERPFSRWDVFVQDHSKKKRVFRTSKSVLSQDAFQTDH